MTPENIDHEYEHEAFMEWIDENEYACDTPEEWYDAWWDYCDEDGGMYDPDGQPDEAQEWHDYDPDC